MPFVFILRAYLYALYSPPPGCHTAAPQQRFPSTDLSCSEGVRYYPTEIQPPRTEGTLRRLACPKVMPASSIGFPLGLQRPSRFLRKYRIPTFIAARVANSLADRLYISLTLSRSWRTAVRADEFTARHQDMSYRSARYSIVKFLWKFSFRLYTER